MSNPYSPRCNRISSGASMTGAPMIHLRGNRHKHSQVLAPARSTAGDTALYADRISTVGSELSWTVGSRAEITTKTIIVNVQVQQVRQWNHVRRKGASKIITVEPGFDQVGEESH